MPFILTQGLHLDPVGGQFARNISLLVGAEDACARGLEPIERILRRMAVAVARPCADQAMRGERTAASSSSRAFLDP